MKTKIKLRAALFVLLNILWLCLHYFLFMSDAPLYWLPSAGGHILTLFLFPYNKFFKLKKTNNNNENTKR